MRTMFLMIACGLAAFPMSAPANDLLESADKFYEAGKHAEAVGAYRKYLAANKKGKHRCQANYRLGESLRKLDKPAEAEQAFRAAITAIPSDKYVVSANYRLGSIHYNRKEYAKSAPHFGAAAILSNKPNIKRSAQYYRARALRLSKQPKQALAAYLEVISGPEPKSNAFRATAQIEAAKLHIELKQPEKARAILEEMVEDDNTNKDQRAKAEKLIESLVEEKDE